MNLHKQKYVCWPSVGPKDIKQAYIHTSAQRLIGRSDTYISMFEFDHYN